MFKLITYLIKLAVAVCLVVGSTSAMAYLPINNDDGQVTLHWGGASAPTTLSAMELTIRAVCGARNSFNLIIPGDPHILYVPAGGFGADPKRPGSDWAVA